MYKPHKEIILSSSLAILMFLLTSAQAELRDPTRPLSFLETVETEQQTDRLTLSAIWNAGSTKRATINGITAKQGDTILNNIKIIEIRARTVIIRQQGEIQKLSLLSKPIKDSLFQP